MKTSILTMVMIVLTSLNINAKTNSNSWRNTGKNNNTVVVVNTNNGRKDVDRNHSGGHNPGANNTCTRCADKRHPNNRHIGMHRHDMHNHNCVIVKDSKKTYICRICGKHYKEMKHKK